MIIVLIAVSLVACFIVIMAAPFMRSSQISRCEECKEYGAPIGDCPSPACAKRRAQ